MSIKTAFRRIIIFTFISIIFLSLFSRIFSQNSLNKDTSTIRKILNQSDTLYKKDNVKSLQLAKEALEASKKVKFNEGEATANKFMARIYVRQLHLDSAEICYNNSLRIYVQMGKKSEFFSIYNNLGIIYGKRSNYTKARDYFKLSRQAAVEENNTSNILSADNNLIIVYRYLGLWDSCLYILDKIEKQAYDIADTSKLAYCYREKGIILFLQGNYKQALDNHYRSLNLLQLINDKKGMALEKEEIALLYLTIHDYEKTLKLLKDILPDLNSNFEDYMPVLNNIGLAFQGLGLLDSALVYHQKYLELAKAKNVKGYIARGYNQLGKIYYLKGEFAEAMTVLKESVSIYNSLRMKREYAEAANALGNVYLATGKTDMGEKIFLEVLSIAKELNIIAKMRDATEGLHQVNARKRNYKQAYSYALSFKAYSDSTYNMENVKTGTKKELEYEFEKEKAVIAFKHAREELIQAGQIKRQKLIRNSIFIVLLLTIFAAYIVFRFYLRKKKADEEKDALLKEIHHRVKNNLQIISSLLNIQSEYVTDNKVIDIVHENQGRVKAMALIHQLLYQSEKFTRIDFSDYAAQLTKTLSNIYQPAESKIDTHIVAEKVDFDIDTSIPLGLIITELVSNAYKHAFNDSKTGTIQIELQTVAPKSYELTISDNGAGLPDNINIKKINSMGLKLVRILTEQIDGQFKAHNNNGASFTISFSDNY